MDAGTLVVASGLVLISSNLLQPATKNKMSALSKPIYLFLFFMFSIFEKFLLKTLDTV
jgi:hypothetical protein